jgi:adenylosuccinate lyase
MKLVSHGVSRQEAHEQIRVLSREAVNTVKLSGGKNDLIERIKNSEFFVSYPLLMEPILVSSKKAILTISKKPIWGDIDGMLDAKLFIGRSVEIVEKYVGPGGTVEAQLKPYKAYVTSTAAAQLKV